MKKIGYIYKYSRAERKGILVHGRWKTETKICEREVIQDLPIKFNESDCISPIETGVLVYFDFSDNKASSIEKATLNNFDRELLENLLKEEKGALSSWYFDNTHISYEDLSDIIIPENDSRHPINKKTSNESSFSEDVSREPFAKNDSKTIPIEQKRLDLPERIDDVFDCFGKYSHRRSRRLNNRLWRLCPRSTSQKNLNILDLSLWTNFDFSNKIFFGRKREEIKFLYDIFINKGYYNCNGELIYGKVSNNCISDSWQKILANCSNEELLEILNYAPKLQPAFPLKFCKTYAGLLSDEYGMPDVEICKLHCLHKISNTKTVSEYKNLKNRFFAYYHCEAKHLEGEGTPMSQLGKRRINNLEKKLDFQYETVIKQNVITQLTEICENATLTNETQNIMPEEFYDIALFIERYHDLKNNFLGYEIIEKALESYNSLPASYKDALKKPFQECINESAISATEEEELSPFLIGNKIEKLGNWVLEHTKQDIQKILNKRFSNLNNPDDLKYAYRYGYITEEQYFNRYKQLTSSYTINQLFEELAIHKIEDTPMIIQWYIVSTIIDKLEYVSLKSFNYIRIGHEVISGIKSLLIWLNQRWYLHEIVRKNAEEKICSVLTDEEKWILFEEKTIETPGVSNIRKYLDSVYRNENTNYELLKRSCIQDVMLSDTDAIKESKILLFIANHLDSQHQVLMQQKATGFLKLYLWQKQPSDNFNWNLAKKHYHELSAKAQIRSLLYIFRLMATGESSLVVDDLYSAFVATSTPACSAVCGILIILRTKKGDINTSISSALMDSITGRDQEQKSIFLEQVKSFFYSCNGYLAITGRKKNIEHQSYNGILTKELVNDILHYVITFHEYPINIFGHKIEWENPDEMASDDIDTAKQILVRNTDVMVVDGKYYIPASQEFFVKQFVVSYHIDDHCGLISDKAKMIEQGYLARNNAFLPLYTNWLGVYDFSDYYVCRCGYEGGSDPDNSFPFFWCKKRICARRAHFFLPPSQWEYYCFADLLYIVMGQSPNVREHVWRVNAEISQFICDYAQSLKSNGGNIFSSPLNESEERGIWDKDTSTYRDVYDEDYEEYNEDYYEEYDDYPSYYSEPTYDRYHGTYAQNEMGYSDNDIDTIFDGDPDAYWNID